ncbi:Hsp20/alpha crystallin family protein [Haloplanus sp. GCM10025708]|uniref:Hsp20/alpha crystallin family protein n=1 Tax=Haloferacaceae TaxID=1644056 RepID=UPI003614E185
MTSRLDRIERRLGRLGRRLERGHDECTYDGDDTTDYHLGAADVVEAPDRFLVHVDLPGFDESDVDIELTDHTLRVVATREGDAEPAGTFLRRERPRSSVEQTLYLPKDVDREAATATLDDGVLTVDLPKAGDGRTRRIELS